MIKIKETNDYEYLKEIIEMQESDEYAFDVAKQFIVKCWDIYSGKARSGVAYLSKIADKYYFDAYKDFRVKNSIHDSLIAGELVLDEIKNITNVVYSMHKIEDRQSTTALFRLGFREVKDYISFKKELE